MLSACTASYISESELSAVGWLFYIGNTIESELSAVGWSYRYMYVCLLS